MKNLLFVFIISLSFNFSVLANRIDTIKITNPTYFSEFERTNFENFLKTKQPDVFALSLSSDSTSTESGKKTYKQSIDRYLTTIKSSIDKPQSEKSKINKIFKTAHESFFVQYDLNSLCTEFYTQGKFNCVTGSLFFTFILDSLKIPYSIKENPTHVFLLAYPATFSIPVESTDPNLQSIIPNADFKKNYVNFLLDSKIIQKSEVTTNGIESVFNENYYSNTNITPIELVGLLYYNSGVQFLIDKNIMRATQQFEKAYILYPSERIRFALEASLVSLAGDDNEFNLDRIDYLAKLANYTKNKIYKGLVTNIFNDYTRKYLINENNEIKYEQIYNRLSSQLEDSTVKADIATMYFHERSRVCSIKGDIDNSWLYACQGYKINPKNVDILDGLRINFILKMKPDIYSDTFMARYDAVLNEYPILRKNNEITLMAAVHYLYKGYVYFSQNNTVSGEVALKNLETLLNEYTNCKPDPTMIAQTYCEAASAYYRKNNINKCKTIIERGLVLVPNNEQLIRKYKINVTQEIK